MIKDLIEQGIQAQIDRGNESEAGKVGTLRAGNTGMVNDRGEIIGSCAAMTYLRMKGISNGTVDINKELMFAGGRLNEDHWLSALKESYKGVIKCEEEIPIHWKTSNGINVTGRPDIILCNDDGSPKCGIELKQCMSVNSAYNTFVKKEPQLKHLMQAAHYMWQHDCPFELWYTNRNNLDMPSWMEFREFPRPEHEETGVIGYRYYRMGDMNPKTGKPRKHQITEAEYQSKKFPKSFGAAAKLKPFIQGFNLMLEGGQLFYQAVDPVSGGSNHGEWQETIVKIRDIQRYYEYVSELDSYGKVPPEVLNLNAHGKAYGWKYSAYSDLGNLDPAHHVGMNLQKWVQKIIDSKS